MTHFLSGGDADARTGTAGMFPVGLAMLAPVFAIPMTVGTSRVVLIPVVVYAVFILVSLAVTWVLEERYATTSNGSE